MYICKEVQVNLHTISPMGYLGHSSATRLIFNYLQGLHSINTSLQFARDYLVNIKWFLGHHPSVTNGHSNRSLTHAIYHRCMIVMHLMHAIYHRCMSIMHLMHAIYHRCMIVMHLMLSCFLLDAELPLVFWGKGADFEDLGGGGRTSEF